ncbi:cytochrome P450 [Kibdelosporangium persicum]
MPLLGHGPAMARDPMRFLRRLRDQGDVVTCCLGTVPVHQINSPELIRRVLVTDAHRFGRNRIFANARQLFGDGLATADEPVRMRQRRIMQPAFHRDRTDAYVDIMRTEIQRFVDRWRAGEVVVLDREVSRITLAVTAKALFRADLGSAAVGEVCRSLGPVLDGITKRAMLPAVYERIPTPGNRRFDAALRWFTTIVDDVTKAYRDSGADHGDLLSMLVASPMTDAEIRTQVLNILMAGTDTTAITLSWAFHELAVNPPVRRRMLAEIDTVLGGRPVTAADLPRLSYVDRVVAGTVRRHTPVWLLMRKALEPVRLGDVTIDAGAQVMISLPTLHRDPDLFPDPMRFDPDRPLDEQARTSALVPFGAGRHRCTGEAFAMAEMTTALVTVSRNWVPNPVPGHRVREVTRAFLRPDALPMTVYRRNTRNW